MRRKIMRMKRRIMRMRKRWCNMRGRLGNRVRFIRKKRRKMSRLFRSGNFMLKININTTIIMSNFTINLNLTLFEAHPNLPYHSPRASLSPRTPHSPHPTQPSHPPRTPQCSLSSPHALSPHSIPLVTSNFTYITFLLWGVNLHDQYQYQHHSH